VAARKKGEGELKKNESAFSPRGASREISQATKKKRSFWQHFVRVCRQAGKPFAKKKLACAENPAVGGVSKRNKHKLPNPAAFTSDLMNTIRYGRARNRTRLAKQRSPLELHGTDEKNRDTAIRIDESFCTRV